MITCPRCHGNPPVAIHHGHGGWLCQIGLGHVCEPEDCGLCGGWGLIEVGGGDA